MSNLPTSLHDTSLTVFRLAISSSDPWPFSVKVPFPISTFVGTRSLIAGFRILIHYHHHQHLLFHLPHMRKKEVAPGEAAVPPKGCLAVKVGGDEEEKQKFVVPVMYLNHPLFISLLKEAEEEYGFDHKGPLTIPCHTEYFRQVQGIINHDTGVAANNGHHHHHPHLLMCFKT